MLAVWPFKRRSIRHRTFGTLRPVRNGQFWQAKLPLEPRPAASPVEVQISAGADGPTEAQENLYLQLAKHYPKILAVALKAVHREYQRVVAAQPQLKWPQARGAADLRRLTPLGRVWLDDAHGHKFVLSFAHDHDKEHEFHVFFRNWKLESVASER